MKSFSPPANDRKLRSSPLPSAKLNEAVHQVIRECCSSARPFLCLGNFVRRLSDDPAWSRSDIMEVQTKALRMLKMMINSDDDDCGRDEYGRDEFDLRRTQRWDQRDLQPRS